MKQNFKIFLAQLNPTGGDIEGNYKILVAARERALKEKVDIILAPEMFLSGYPIDDLVLRPDFMYSIEKHINKLADKTKTGPAIIVGAPRNDNGVLRNSAFILDEGKIIGYRDKSKLPNEDEFYDNRQFVPGDLAGPILLRGLKIGIPICQDIWEPEVCECLKESGAELIFSINGSTYNINKMDLRLNVTISRAVENEIPLIYLNMVGGQDELIFDGGSFAINNNGKLAAQLPMFKTCDGIVELEKTSKGWVFHSSNLFKDQTGYESLYSAIVLSLRDYVYKNGFSNVIFGLSGGIDSALVASIAVDALGPDNVKCFMLPSVFTSKNSTNDAIDVAKRLNIELDTLSIKDIYNSVENLLSVKFKSKEKDITEENIQSRTRGAILMAYSNKFGHMVLTNGNKSEVSVGYSTLYGDMCGGFSVVKDIYKSDLYKLAEWRNNNIPSISVIDKLNVMPLNIINKEPTAELKENQKDSDSLPPYEVLDKILYHLVEKEKSIKEITDMGFDFDLVKKVEHLLYSSEYKRRQAAPGVKISERNFGYDRRYPITNSFRDMDN